MRTILYVDDNPNDLLDHLTLLQRELQAKIIITKTYHAALELLNMYTFDLFIIDIELAESRYTGIQFANEIRKTFLYSTTPIVFVSMYSHYSKRLLSTVHNCAFLTKPVASTKLLRTVGCFWGIPQFLSAQHTSQPLIIQLPCQGCIEINPDDISYIEINQNELIVQYINGHTMHAKCQHGCFKSILAHIQAHRINHLKQIHRSFIINVEQIKSVNWSGNSGYVYLFGDPIPKPIGNRYRDQLSEFL